MDQAFTMLVALIEVDGFKWELLLSLFMINALALALSHYPIYNYYAANLNNSANFTTWEEVYPFKRLLKSGKWKLNSLFKVFIFHEKSGGTYKKDDRAHYLRYSIGLLIHAVWIFFIIKTFLPKFNFTEGQKTTALWTFYASCFVPLLHYIYLRKAVQKAKRDENTAAIYRKLAIRFTILLSLTIVLVLLCLFYGAMFSRGGFFLLVITCYLFMFNYLYFRLVRTKLKDIVEMYVASGSKLVRFYMKTMKRLFFRSEHYLLLFSFNFLIAMIVILWTSYNAITVGNLPNGTPILLAFFYAYYFVIAALGKFFFAYNKLREQTEEETGEVPKHTFRFKLVCVSLFLFVAAFIGGMFSESRTHQLDLVNHDKSADLNETEFIDGIRAMEGNSVFFIASHGGGLKSNAWTLHVLEKLHQETKGALMKRTIALSGASGGSLGLALYTGLSKETSGDFNSDTALLHDRIKVISKGNYTSSDLALTFGLDTFRKLWFFNREFAIQDRPYYAMIKYQNYVEDTTYRYLSKKPFRRFWREVYDKNTYFPSLIMNTAATTGKRGVLWSVKANNFNNIFHFSENLGELRSFDDTGKALPKTLSFYEAVSTTNRFPVFSPAAKIPGYGHYIDAGAIDNSGMLGCLDLYLYLQSKDNYTFLNDKNIVFIEIINGKTLYLQKLLNSLEKDIEKNENETDNIIADMQTALNLDKIPGYVSDFVSDYPKIELIRIYMPHKVTIGDVEGYLNGKMVNRDQRDALIAKLKLHNDYIDSITGDGANTGESGRFFKEWNTYEPTLSRHLSESSLLFIERILKHSSITESIGEVKKHIQDSL